MGALAAGDLRPGRMAAQGADRIVGVDEVGRGCLAGPVTVAGVRFESIPTNRLIQDSKTMTPVQRERAAEWVRSNCDGWLVFEVWPELIDRINILEAVRLAMRTVVAQWLSASPFCDCR